ncbi:polyhydroxybutyrate depolymerase [Jannaschia sp. S6380]|uniref:alpha/beta hydrolase family esterase n=1 Tax=Jannaschia sp. S6380 TaxID=2926408 RepID=UPI001FF6F218|nr:polyhydroxybutyrate depolymerase [Jannaschia sp. S6380]MCK0169228.1 polyhydroxybutyrate depolymerase [Jannaschia sp. S6380]
MRCLILLMLLVAGPALACGPDRDCPLGDRSYNLRLPDGWDGASPLPVLLHFHGWGRQGEVPLGSPRTGGAARRARFLMVTPDGLNRSWDFRRTGGRDTPFAEAVLRDVARRYPVNGRLVVSGYSWGALMAARFACETSVEVSALLLVAGAFPPDTPCDGRPMRVSHVHGTTDTVLDFPYGPGGDPTHAVALWKRHMGCGPRTRRFDWQAVSWLTHTRHEWDCAAGRLTMDVHGASHLIPRGWFARHLAEIADMPTTRAAGR